MDNLKQRELALIEFAKTVNKGRKPQFGDRMRNPWAGDKNQTRDGVFVKSGHRSGMVNHGSWYQFTDCNGKFWETRTNCVLFIDHIPKEIANNEDLWRVVLGGSIAATKGAEGP